MSKVICIKGQVPSKSNQYRIGVMGGKNVKPKGMIYKSEEMKIWETEFMCQLTEHWNPRIKGKFSISIKVYYRAWKSDLDNSLKGILDCLQKSGWVENDKDCVFITAEKAISKDSPRVYFKLEKIE